MYKLLLFAKLLKVHEVYQENKDAAILGKLTVTVLVMLTQSPVTACHVANDQRRLNFGVLPLHTEISRRGLSIIDNKCLTFDPCKAF